MQVRFFDPFGDQVRAFSDEDLLRAFERARDRPDDPDTRTLLAEIERRALTA